MTEKEIDDFREYASHINASFDEFKLLISILVNEAAMEFLHAEMMRDIKT